MKYQIVKFENGTYGVRKTNWFRLIYLIPLFWYPDPHLYLMLETRYDYDDRNLETYWQFRSKDFPGWFQTTDKDSAQRYLTKWLEAVEGRKSAAQKAKEAHRAFRRDKGKPV